MIDKLMAAGLGTLAPLFAARADEIAAVTGIPDAIAAAVGRAHPGVPPRDPGGAGDGRSGGDDPRAGRAARAAAHRARGVRGGRARLDGGAIGWPRSRLRRRRQATFLQITIALVRLGEIDFALRLPKLPFARRIDELERVVTSRRAPPVRSNRPADSGTQPVAA